VQLVLHGGKEAFGGGGRDIVVDGGGVDVCDFLVEFALAEPDFANALELLFEVFFPRMVPSFFRRSSSIAKPLMVNCSMMPVAHLRNCTARSEFTL
jgi:hypothetical protein